MTTSGGSSPQVSWWRVVVVPAWLVNPSVVGTAWATLPALVREMAESQIDMTPECLMGWRVFRKPGNVTEDGVPAACDEIRHWTYNCVSIIVDKQTHSDQQCLVALKNVIPHSTVPLVTLNNASYYRMADGSTFLCEIKSCQPSWKYHVKSKIQLHQLMRIYLKNNPEKFIPIQFETTET